MRHAALLKRENTLFVFWTQVGYAPETILLSAIDVSGVFVPIIALDGTFIPSHTPSGYVVRLWPCATDSTNGATP